MKNRVKSCQARENCIDCPLEVDEDCICLDCAHVQPTVDLECANCKQGSHFVEFVAIS